MSVATVSRGGPSEAMRYGARQSESRRRHRRRARCASHAIPNAGLEAASRSGDEVVRSFSSFGTTATMIRTATGRHTARPDEEHDGTILAGGAEPALAAA
jgi:hypothetical protein